MTQRGAARTILRSWRHRLDFPTHCPLRCCAVRIAHQPVDERRFPYIRCTDDIHVTSLGNLLQVGGKMVTRKNFFASFEHRRNQR